MKKFIKFYATSAPIHDDQIIKYIPALKNPINAAANPQKPKKKFQTFLRIKMKISNQECFVTAV